MGRRGTQNKRPGSVPGQRAVIGMLLAAGRAVPGPARGLNKRRTHNKEILWDRGPSHTHAYVRERQWEVERERERDLCLHFCSAFRHFSVSQLANNWKGRRRRSRPGSQAGSQSMQSTMEPSIVVASFKCFAHCRLRLSTLAPACRPCSLFSPLSCPDPGLNCIDKFERVCLYFICDSDWEQLCEIWKWNWIRIMQSPRKGSGKWKARKGRLELLAK